MSVSTFNDMYGNKIEIEAISTTNTVSITINEIKFGNETLCRFSSETAKEFALKIIEASDLAYQAVVVKKIKG